MMGSNKHVPCVTSLYEDQQFDAAEEAALQSINLLPERLYQCLICSCYRLLGEIHSSKGDIEEATSYFEAALRIVSSFGWHHDQFWNHHGLAVLFFNQGRSTTRTLVLEIPSCLLLMTRTLWVTQCGFRLTFGMSKAGLEKRGRRFCVLRMLLRRSGPRGIWRSVEASSVISKRQ